MRAAIKLKVQITEDHTVQLPEDIPAGPAMILLLAEPADANRRAELAERRRRALGAASGRFTVPEDFDAPLPPEILQHFLGKNIEPEEA